MTRTFLARVGRALLWASLALWSAVPLQAQGNGFNSALLTVFSTATSSSGIKQNSLMLYHQIKWTPVAASACQVQIDSSTDGISWTAGGILATQTCTSVGNSAIVSAQANYVRMTVTSLTGTSVSVQYEGWAFNPSGGAGAVSSVFTRTGAVVAASGDYTCAQVTNCPATPISAAQGGTGVANTVTLTLGTSAQNWGTLGTGIVKNTTTTGAQTIAVGSDLPAAIPIASVGSAGLSGTLPISIASTGAISVVLSGNNAQTTTYQVLASDFSSYKDITVASGTFTITLVANGTQPAAGQYINVVNYGSGSVTIARSGQNLNGSVTSIVLPPANNAQQPTAAHVQSDGTNYFASVSGANAATLGNKTFAVPNPIGATTPNTGAFTSLTATGVIVGGNTVRLTADSAGITALTPGTTVLTLGTLTASTNYSFFCELLYSQATAAVLDGFSVQAGTNAATRWDAWGSMDTTNPASTTMTGSKGSALNVTTTTSTPVVSATPGAITTVFQARLTGTIQVGASVPTVTVAAFTGNASDAVTIKAGSFCTVTP